MSKYRVPLTVAATVSTTLFVEAATAAYALEAARTALLAGGRVLLQADPPHEAALREAVVMPGEAVAEIADAEFAGVPTSEAAPADAESELTPIELERYLLSEGSNCPFCGTWDIAGRSIDIECASAYQTVTCNHCDGNWVDRYRLAIVGPYLVHRPDRAAIEAARDGATANA
jgi:hypothetical protein